MPGGSSIAPASAPATAPDPPASDTSRPRKFARRQPITLSRRGESAMRVVTAATVADTSAARAARAAPGRGTGGLLRRVGEQRLGPAGGAVVPDDHVRL